MEVNSRVCIFWLHIDAAPEIGLSDNTCKTGDMLGSVCDEVEIE